MNATSLFALVATALLHVQASAQPNVADLCARGDFAGIMNIPPTAIAYKQFKVCLKNKNFYNDAALAQAITYAPDALPTKAKAFNKWAHQLYKHNMLASLRAYLSNGRCSLLKPKLRDFLLKDAQLNLAPICAQQAAVAGIVPGGGSPTPTTTPTASTAGGAAPVAPASPIDGSVKDWDESRVRDQKDILARLTQDQAQELGVTNNACLGLSSAHFGAPSVRGEVVANLSVRCFRTIPPEAFGGMNKSMVKMITAWPFVRRAQLKAIKNDVIVAVPFDQLGIGKQSKSKPQQHACFGITNSQLKAIKKDKTAKKLYNYRCVKNAAVPQAPSPFFHVGASLAVAIMLVVL